METSDDYGDVSWLLVYWLLVISYWCTGYLEIVSGEVLPCVGEDRVTIFDLWLIRFTIDSIYDLRFTGLRQAQTDNIRL